MNSSNYRFTLDMQSNQSQVSLPVRLGDTNRRLYIILTDGGTPFILEDGFRAVLFGRKADGKTLNNDCIIENKSTIRYDFTSNTASKSGVVDCELRVYDAQGKLVTTPRFILVVDERVLYDDDIVSESERSALDAIYGSETARENAEKDRIEAEVKREERMTEFEEEVTASLANLVDAHNSDEEAHADIREQVAYLDGIADEAISQLNERVGNVETNLATVESIAKGANQAVSFRDYEELISVFNNTELTPRDKYEIGQNIYIQQIDVPDLWVSYVMDYPVGVSRTVDEFLKSLLETGEATVGYYYISVLETQKVDLTEYATKQDLADGLKEVSIADGLFTERLFNEAKTHTDEQVSAVKTSIAETANAIKGKISGEIVRVSDVSPIEHTVKCKVRSKNLYDNLSNYKNGTYTYSNGTLTVTDRYAHKFIELEEGKTYTFSCQSTRTGADGGGVHIRAYKEDQRTYVDIQGGSIINLLSPSFTLTMPKGYPYIRIAFYGHSTSDGTGSATYTELMLEESKEATEYVPYIDATTATVTRYGKNLLDLSRATFTSAKYNKTVNGITCNINNSYYSGVRVDYLNDFLLANKGKTLTFSIADAIDDVLITLLIYGTRTSGKTNQEGSTTGEREISFAISDEFTAITGLEVRVNRKTEAFTDTTTVVRNMQVEVRDTASDFEVYKEATTHTPSADGTVEGIKSISPTMTLFTDTANVVVEIEYNQDINVLNKRLVEALDAIIAIQKTLIGGTSQ